MKGESVYHENTSDKCDIQWYITEESCITILYNAIKITNRINITNS